MPTSEEKVMTEYQQDIANRFDQNFTQWVHCLVCYTPSSFLGTKLCDNCWNVERSLHDYLATETGRKQVLSIMKGLGFVFEEVT